MTLLHESDDIFIEKKKKYVKLGKLVFETVKKTIHTERRGLAVCAI